MQAGSAASKASDKVAEKAKEAKKKLGFMQVNFRCVALKLGHVMHMANNLKAGTQANDLSKASSFVGSTVCSAHIACFYACSGRVQGAFSLACCAMCCYPCCCLCSLKRSCCIDDWMMTGLLSCSPQLWGHTQLQGTLPVIAQGSCSKSMSMSSCTGNKSPFYKSIA